MNIIQEKLEKVADAAYQSAVEAGIEKNAAVSKMLRMNAARDLKDGARGALNVLGLSNKSPRLGRTKDMLAKKVYDMKIKDLNILNKVTSDDVYLLRALSKASIPGSKF